MLLPLAVCISNVLFVTSFVLPESFSIAFKDSGEFKVDESIDESDYEMVRSGHLSGFHLEDKENNLEDLNRLASKDYQITTASIKRLKTRGYTALPRTQNTHKSYRPRRHRNADPSTVFVKTNHPLTKTAASEDIQPNYDYNEMLMEYIAESIEEGESNQTYHESSKEKYENELLRSLDKIFPIDETLNAITKITKKNVTNKNSRSESNIKEKRQDTKVVVEKLWRFIKIMLIVYVILTIPFWCTKGWCCCCLCCRVFKPHKTIAAAKTYLIRNPPGVHTSKGRQKKYEPTDGERDSYEELEHLIRTM